MTNATDESLPKFKCACLPRSSCSFENDFCLTDTKVSHVFSHLLKVPPICCSATYVIVLLSVKVQCYVLSK